MVRRVGGRAQATVRRLCRVQAAAAGARLRRPAALLVGDGRRARAGRAGRGPVRPRAGRRIPGHQPAAGGHPARHETRRPGPDRGRGRRPVDLFVPRRHGAQHPRLPAAVRPAGADRHAGAQLPVDPADPRRLQCAHRRRRRAACQDTVDRQALGRPAAAGAGARRSAAGLLGRRPGVGASRGRPGAEVAGGAVPHLQPQRRAGTGTGAAQHPLREVRGPQVPGGGPTSRTCSRCCVSPRTRAAGWQAFASPR